MRSVWIVIALAFTLSEVRISDLLRRRKLMAKREGGHASSNGAEP